LTYPDFQHGKCIILFRRSLKKADNKKILRVLHKEKSGEFYNAGAVQAEMMRHTKHELIRQWFWTDTLKRSVPEGDRKLGIGIITEDLWGHKPN